MHISNNSFHSRTSKSFKMMCYNSESNDDSIESAGSGTCISKNSRTLRLKIHYDIFNLSLDKSESSKYKRHFEK